jgi:CubicO group peptidase (beta-lactamase class C family)
MSHDKGKAPKSFCDVTVPHREISLVIPIPRGVHLTGLLVCLATANVACGSDTKTTVTDAAARAHALLSEQIAPKVPGVAAAVAVAGQLVWSDARGYADLEAGKLVNASSRFRIGSISKSLTAAGLMQLVERGAIDLDAPVQHYVPDFPVKAEGMVTTRLLAGHLAGIATGSNSSIVRFSTSRPG